MDHFAITTRPSWNTIAWPSPTNLVSGTRAPTGSRYPASPTSTRSISTVFASNWSPRSACAVRLTYLPPSNSQLVAVPAENLAVMAVACLPSGKSFSEPHVK